jgi:phosphohistidine phosphatase
MKVLLVRHAIALDRETPGVSDDLRPLTEEGVIRFKRTARALAGLVRADIVLTSPLLRAKQTAEILARQWEGVGLQESESLGNGSRPRFEQEVARLPSATVVAAVGHEPHVSGWTADWLGAGSGGGFPFKKGGAALIDFEDGVRTGLGRLVFFLPPKILKDL